MIIATFAFYLFAVVAVISGLLVITAKNPVHSVLWLILAFFNAAGLFVLLGAEFLAMLLVVVYVGAVAVLFLFVVMMLDLNTLNFREGYQQYMPLGLAIGLVLLVELATVGAGWALLPEVEGQLAAPIAAAEAAGLSNTEALGHILYTDYVYFFQAAGIILLVAMVGAIMLTHRSREGVRKQKIGRQLARDPAASVEVKKVETGRGI
ncbi:NADH-ubiquinone oxidoreductase chain J [Caenispirillum salinarum AK4]|uniref:NADH-quinone oxidoreductase subunit J n=1 Tax=Caenispirillum salinarum AK4 TaxID=1238182 RepID=K9HQX4_9PROT|nr:NADH-quinone oxidoreductase subunit J [Caenispirillum salinarum]EKV30846.1 NADH-ubiquinone oxidoreductase chain J [Caenispirillum salinarum AK4]